MATIIELPDLSIVSPSHPDHETLLTWLNRYEVHHEWIVIPSTIKVTKAGINVVEYLRDEAGSVRLAPPAKRGGNYKAMTAPMLYEHRDVSVPKFKELRVSDA